MKITVFVMNMKFAVKLELGLLEQTYKLRESEKITGLEDVQRLIDQPFLDACMERFAVMGDDLLAAYGRDSVRWLRITND